MFPSDFKYVLQLRDQAEAIKRYVRISKDIQHIAAEMVVRASRRLGELLAVEVKHGGQNKARSPESTSLKDMGISRNESSKRQKIAALPEDEFEKYIQLNPHIPIWLL